MQITIESDDAPKGKKSKKSRSFSSELLAYVEADALWQTGSPDPKKKRPAWLAFGSSQQEARIFWTNLCRGKIARMGDSNTEKLEILRSSGFEFHTQKIGGGVVYFAYLPELFLINPGMVDPDGIRFVMLPSKAWLERQRPQTNPESLQQYLEQVEIPVPDNADLALLEAEAMLFLLYLDRRTRYPIPSDPRFAVHLMLRAIDAQIALRHTGGSYSYSYTRSKPFVYNEHETNKVGLAPGLAVKADHEGFNEFMAAEIQAWHKVVSKEAVRG